MYLLSVFPFFQGANELHIVFILDIVLLGLLIYKVVKNKEFIFSKDIKFIMILLWSFAYLFTCFYSLDTELSFLGFLKFFTVPIFLTLVMQYNYSKEQKSKWFEAIPVIGSIMMAIISFSILIGKQDVFFANNRLAGFFNYANSFALFLLIGLIVTGFKEKLNAWDFVITSLLLIGIILANSRSIMIITAFSYILVIVFNKKIRKENFINAGILILVGVVASYIMSRFGVANRIAETSASSSEWLLRILYYKDALRLIAKNIFGYGYMAWWYMQEGFQTGAYDAQFIHNGLLQVAVDAGIVPALLIVTTFVLGFFDKKTVARDRVLMLIILGHSLIEFNMEFMAVMLILFMTLEFDKKVKTKKCGYVKGVLGLMCGIYVFFALVTVFNAVGDYASANALFPYSLALNGEMENATEDKIINIAEKLYEKNKYFVNASVILSQKEQLLNNYEGAYKYELWVVENKKYTMLNYIKYVQFLESAIKYYYAEKDFESMKKYIERLSDVPNIIESVKAESDELAYKIAHKPRLDMPEEMTKYIEEMKVFGERY